ncbi:MAG: YdbH domain-containing protein [Candidatus Lindowbacteria bacterium]|nr:YdbH domain-containing protein [Candidatus Lindowbacteria bacterium]
MTKQSTPKIQASKNEFFVHRYYRAFIGVSIGLLIAIVAVVVSLPWYLQSRIEDAVTNATGLEASLSGLHITFVPRAKKVTLRVPGSENNVAEIHELQIVPDWSYLLIGKPRLRHIFVESLNIRWGQEEAEWWKKIRKRKGKVSGSSNMRSKLGGVTVRKVSVTSKLGTIDGSVEIKGLSPGSIELVKLDANWPEANAVLKMEGLDFPDGRLHIRASGPDFAALSSVKHFKRLTDLLPNNGRGYAWSIESQKVKIESSNPIISEWPEAFRAIAGMNVLAHIQNPQGDTVASLNIETDQALTKGEVHAWIRSIKDYVEVPMQISVDIHGGKIQYANLEFDAVPLRALSGFLSGGISTIINRSVLVGDVSGNFHYKVAEHVEGNILLKVHRFKDPVSQFEVQNLRVALPFRQRLVDPQTVMFDESTRWPEVPINLSARRLGLADIRAHNLTARSVFSDYVLRVRDMSFNILGAQAQSRFILDPFRSPEKLIRSALELKVKNLDLLRLFNTYVGTGVPAGQLKGKLGFTIEAAWSDTNCIEAKGRLASQGPGMIPKEVFRVLSANKSADKRLPDAALALIGDLHYDELEITLERSPQHEDFLATIRLYAPREPFLPDKGITIENVRLLNLIEGMKVVPKMRMTRSPSS